MNKPGIILLTIILVTALLLTGCDVGTATKTTTAVAPINLIIAVGSPLKRMLRQPLSAGLNVSYTIRDP